MDIEARIAQFENMAQSDPDNEMAHYSLAGAYMQANRFAEAADSYLRCIAISPGMSKAYQLAGEAYLKGGNPTRAAEVFAQGYVLAAERGDRMPQSAMAEHLKALGKPVPEVAAKPAAAGPGGGSGLVGLGRGGAGTAGKGTPMEKAPFRGPLGEWIRKNVSQEKWESWIGQGTKVINELRLDLSSDRDAEVYDQHMREYLGIDEALYGKILDGQA